MKNLTHHLAVFANTVFTVVGALLGFRFVLRLFGANSSNEIVSWIYDTSQPLVEPFETIFPTVRTEDGFVLEVTTLLALLVYGIVAAIVINFVMGLAATSSKKKK